MDTAIPDGLPSSGFVISRSSAHCGKRVSESFVLPLPASVRATKRAKSNGISRLNPTQASARQDGSLGGYGEPGRQQTQTCQSDVLTWPAGRPKSSRKLASRCSRPSCLPHQGRLLHGFRCTHQRMQIRHPQGPASPTSRPLFSRHRRSTAVHPARTARVAPGPSSVQR